MSTLDHIAIWFGYICLGLNMARVILVTSVELMIGYRRVIRYYSRHAWAHIALISWGKKSSKEASK